MRGRDAAQYAARSNQRFDRVVFLGSSGFRVGDPALTALVAASMPWDDVSIGWARDACGYLNRERFRNAILFRLRSLDLHPRPVSTHTSC